MGCVWTLELVGSSLLLRVNQGGGGGFLREDLQVAKRAHYSMITRSI